MSHENVGEFQLGGVDLPTGRKSFGVMVSGVPVGDAEYVSHMMKTKTSKVVRQIKNITNRLQLNSCQNLFALLVQCLHQKLQFWMKTMAPEVLEKHLNKAFRSRDAGGCTPGYFPSDGSLPPVQEVVVVKKARRCDDKVSVGRVARSICGRHLSVCAVVHTVS